MKKPLKLAWNEKKKKIWKRLNQPIGKGKNPAQFALFLRQFSELLKAGIHSHEAVGLLKDQSELKSLKPSLDHLEKNLSSGMAMSDAISEDVHFTSFLTSMIRTGEQTGELPEICQRLSEYYQLENERKQKIRRALLYPIIVMITLLFVMIFLLIYVLPTFVTLFQDSGAQLPWNTLLLLKITSFFNQYGVHILLFSVLLFILFFFSMKQEKIRYGVHKFWVKFPGYRRLRKELFTEKIASNLALVLQNGVPLLQGLEILTEGMENLYHRQVFQEIQEDLIRGKTVTEAFHRDIFTKLLVTMISVGERTGKLAEGFKNTGDFYKKETAYSIEKALQILEPVLIFIMSFLVGFVVLSIATPMFDLVNQMDVY
ncbi:MAG: type II secretion system F family protein [Tissierellia bacterium]|nr:type II secretion system F family protein [Tissierellia bacterium]